MTFSYLAIEMSFDPGRANIASLSSICIYLELFKGTSSWPITPRNGREAKGNGVGDVSLLSFKNKLYILSCRERRRPGPLKVVAA